MWIALGAFETTGERRVHAPCVRLLPARGLLGSAAVAVTLVLWQGAFAQQTLGRSAVPSSRQSSVNTQARTPAGQAAASARSTSDQTRAVGGSEVVITRSRVRNAVDSDVQLGYAALQQNKLTEARQAYARALQKQPTQRDALLGIAYAHHGLGEMQQALSTLRHLLELYPRDDEALSALVLMGGGEAQEQETLLKQVLDRGAGAGALHHALGVLYFEQSRFSEAHKAFEKANAFEPDQPDYAFNLAVALDRLGRHRDAMRQYVVALNLANQYAATFGRDLVRARVRMLTSVLNSSSTEHR